MTDIESFISFNEGNIDEYYMREVLKEDTDKEKETSEILKDASQLHEDLRNYGSLKDIDKPLIVSGILLALRESDFKNFSVLDLTGDNVKTDGQKIYDAISNNLIRSKVSPITKRDKMLSQFSIIKNTEILNTKNEKLGKTPLRYFTEFLNDKIYKHIRYNKSSEDYLGRFYGEFMSYSGGDGQSLGIVLTPKHITDLFCELVGLKVDDIVLDPCCGTAGFLIACLHYMLELAISEEQRKNIKKNQLHGFELQSYMFTIATTNMILRGDGKSNLINEDFLKQNPSKLQLKQSTVGMINPPYSQGSKENPSLYEISFVEHMLDSLVEGGRGIAIIPQSSVTGKTNEEKSIKESILSKHTLEGVITLNEDTFYRVGTMPCIAIFTAGEPHPDNKICKFIDFREDGYKISNHIGLVETSNAKDKKQHLLDVWFDRIDSDSKFCVKTCIKSTDEWLHNFYYFNDEIPSDNDFNESISKYLSFEFNVVIRNKEYLLKEIGNSINKKYFENNIKFNIDDRDWKEFKVENLFDIFNSSPHHKKDLEISNKKQDIIPYITRTNLNNGLECFVNKKDTFKTNPGNIIIFGAENATFFYQPFEHITGNKIYGIQHEEFDKYVGLFVQQALNSSVKDCGFSYGQGLTGTREKRRSIMLPVKKDSNEPDWDFMRNYAKEKYLIIINKYIDFLNTEIK
ncbi:MAG: N-6 DNA methylase [Clostridium sp.]|nr:N-6 DNA methylase [Clostridium sp.]